MIFFNTDMTEYKMLKWSRLDLEDWTVYILSVTYEQGGREVRIQMQQKVYSKEKKHILF